MDIQRIFSEIDPQNLTPDDVRRLRKKYAMSRADGKKLEGRISEYRQSDYDTTLKAIIAYAIFAPEKALSWARRKGVFRYSSRWEHTEICLRTLESLADALELPEEERTYLREKANCNWIADFYQDAEKKLRKDIRQHHKKRKQWKIKDNIVVSCLLLEILSYVNFRFRYWNDVKRMGEQKAKDADVLLKYDALSQYSMEEIAAAASYVIYLYTDEVGIPSKAQLWMDTDYVLSDKIEKLLLLACHKNCVEEWETNADYFRYRICSDRKRVMFSASDEPLEKSLRLGYTKTSAQEMGYTERTFSGEEANPPITLRQGTEDAAITLRSNKILLAQYAVALDSMLGDNLFRWYGKKPDCYHYQMRIPVELINEAAPNPRKDSVNLFLEEYGELWFALSEQFRSDVDERNITEHCGYLDLILFKRFFTLLRFIQIAHFPKEIQAKREIYRSIVTVMSREDLMSLTKDSVGGEQKADELLQLLTWSPAKGKLDLQYTPFIKVDEERYYISMDILSASNIIRNSITRSRMMGNQRANSDGTNDPLTKFCIFAFQSCPYHYEIRYEKKYSYAGGNGDIDFLACSENRIYVFELKNAIFPAGPHELRTTYEYIQKASEQLDLSCKALTDIAFRREYFKRWGITNPDRERSVHTCILLGNRLFTAENGCRHPVRYAQELNIILSSGLITNAFGRWRYWGGETFSDDDLARFLSADDLLSKSATEAMAPCVEEILCLGKQFHRKSFNLKPLVLVRNFDRNLHILEKTGRESLEEREADESQRTYPFKGPFLE